MIAPTRMPKPPVLGRRRRSRSPTVGICGTTSRRQWRKRLQPNTIASERSPILSLDPRSNAPHRNNGGRPPTRFTSPVRRVRYLPSARNCDSRRPQLSRTKARESDRSPGRLGWRGETVRRFYYASSVDELFGAPRAGKPTMLDEFATHLHSRFNDRCTSAAALYEELQALGYRGSYSSVRGSLRPLRSSVDRKAVPSRLSALRQPESRYRRSADYLMDATTPRQPHRRRIDRAQAGSCQLPTS